MEELQRVVEWIFQTIKGVTWAAALAALGLAIALNVVPLGTLAPALNEVRILVTAVAAFLGPGIVGLEIDAIRRRQIEHRRREDVRKATELEEKSRLQSAARKAEADRYEQGAVVRQRFELAQRERQDDLARVAHEEQVANVKDRIAQRDKLRRHRDNLQDEHERLWLAEQAARPSADQSTVDHVRAQTKLDECRARLDDVRKELASMTIDIPTRVIVPATLPSTLADAEVESIADEQQQAPPAMPARNVELSGRREPHNG